MKWNYKDCRVHVTVIDASPPNSNLTPVVEIDCREIAGPHTLMTDRTFSRPVDAMDFGANLARDWIDKHWASLDEDYG